MSGINYWLGLLKEKAPAGYAMGLHMKFNAPKLMFQAYSIEWVNHYEENGYFPSDPTIVWAFKNRGACRWRDLIDIDPRGVIADAATFGITYGCTISVEENDNHSIASFARSDREFTDAEIDEIKEILTTIHNEEVDKLELTDKQKMLLRELASGARIADASEKLGIASVTAKTELAAVRELLGTRTTAEAVQRATDLGWLR
ncbi:LuxR family transcriptional regulator [Amylibacter sp. SFDW26]|uniref:autoinducer binding domain-containing protein n=1 Tax=Amylibacter sp. SFDW26 TaxID=2652722 RepID=UPI0012616380|nr:autoinducer binding domain-containing protein [Amylibacter sp. SFDW26]KAB7613694.1 LuxR family transcriptional regulator [Amylibacter sp. SFDW26]